MRTTLTSLAISAAFLSAPLAARAQIPPNLLQQLLPGGQNQAQQPTQNVEAAVREAYERGYRAGRQDQERADQDRARRGTAPNGSYGNQNQDYQRTPYGR